MPKLSASLTGPRDPSICQSCRRGERTLFGEDARKDDLTRWLEHDEHDHPTSTVVVLCTECSDDLIEKHPRLYARLDLHAPHPGCMPICLDCTLRDGTRCTSPRAKANGGAGVILSVPRPTSIACALRDRRHGGGGPMTLWNGPVSACQQKQQRGAPQNP